MCDSAQVNRFVMQPRFNVDFFSPSRGSNSSFAKWSRNVETLDTSVNGSAAQERNSNCYGIEKVGVKSLPCEIVADLGPSKRVNLANSIIRESPKFKKCGLLFFDAKGKPNIDFAPSTRSKSLNSTQRENFKSE